VQTVVSFYQSALAVFARHPRVQRYAWYPWSTNLTLVNSDGSLTALGTA
jgi:Glycosyl hydrolase catalytic core